MDSNRPVVHPIVGVGDLWPAVAAATPSAVVDAAIWESLAGVAAAIPGPVVGFERPIDDPNLSEWGFPLPRWQRTNALANDHAAIGHVRTLARVWLTSSTLDEFCDLQMHTWDIADGHSGTPCVFLRVDGRAPHTSAAPAWKVMLREYARALRGAEPLLDELSATELADRLEDTATATPLGEVSSVGIYLGRPGCPIRLTVRADARPWPDHPIWATVDEVVHEAQWPQHHVIVAFAPGDDPGNTWHVPLLVDRRARPAEALRPLLRALIARGLTSPDLAEAIATFDVRDTLPLQNPTLDGMPALATLWVAPERIKVVVEPGLWRSAKVDLLARVIWRDIAGRVFVDH